MADSSPDDARNTGRPRQNRSRSASGRSGGQRPRPAGQRTTDPRGDGGRTPPRRVTRPAAETSDTAADDAEFHDPGLAAAGVVTTAVPDDAGQSTTADDEEPVVEPAAVSDSDPSDSGAAEPSPAAGSATVVTPVVEEHTLDDHGHHDVDRTDVQPEIYDVEIEDRERAFPTVEPIAPTEIVPLVIPADTSDVVSDVPPVAEPVPDTAVARVPATRSGRPRVRRVTRVVRHIDTWTVFKVAAVFHLVLYATTLIAGVLLWNVANGTGTVDNVERFMESFGWETFEFDGRALFDNGWRIGLFVVIGLTGLAVLAATTFNLITDLVGGVRITVLEEDVVASTDSGHPAAAPRSMTPLR